MHIVFFKKCTTTVTTLGNGDALLSYFCIAQLIQNQTSIFSVLKNVVIFFKTKQNVQYSIHMGVKCRNTISKECE